MQITTILHYIHIFKLAGKQIPPTVINEVHHLSILLQVKKMDQQVLGKHMVDDKADHRVEDQVQEGVEDDVHHRVEDQVQDGVEDAVHQHMEHQQCLIQIVPFQ